jgi:hypothetical protein
MTGWKTFAEQAPEIAAFGEVRFRSGVAYLRRKHEKQQRRL